eukprot:1161677-Pelagomonas_calceolata.AAC.7
MFYFFGGGASPSASPVTLQVTGHTPVVPQTSRPPKGSPSAVAPPPLSASPAQSRGKKGGRGRSKGSDQQKANGMMEGRKVEDVVWIEDDEEDEGGGGATQEEGPTGAKQQQEVAKVVAGKDSTEPVVVRIHFGIAVYASIHRSARSAVHGALEMRVHTTMPSRHFAFNTDCLTNL